MTRSQATRTARRVLLLAAYYAGIVVALVYLYGQGDVTPPPFIYQGF